MEKERAAVHYSIRSRRCRLRLQRHSARLRRASFCWPVGVAASGNPSVKPEAHSTDSLLRIAAQPLVIVLSVVSIATQWTRASFVVWLRHTIVLHAYSNFRGSDAPRAPQCV